MLHAIAAGAALTITSRILAGETRVPEKARGQIAEIKEGLEKLSEIADEFNPSRPSTWLNLGTRVLDSALNERRWSSQSHWCLEHGFNVSESRQFRLWNELIWSLPREVVCRLSHSQLLRVRLPNGACFVYEGELKDREATTRGTVLLPDDPVARAAVYEGARAHFWSGRKAMLLDVIEHHHETISDVDLGATPYLGDLSLIEYLEAFRAKGVRRNILLQGKPGTGKSTLCREAARRLSSRTLILTAQYLDNVASSDWQMLLQLLAPDMVIVDDIDRIGYNLEGKLTLFEEGHCSVPFVLMTSNELERLPQAMRRPGRIDMILELDEPEPEVMDEIILGLAKREGVEVPQDHLEWLREMAQATSTAHVVEVFRRARVHGWGFELEGDITYSDGFCPQIPKEPKKTSSTTHDAQHEVEVLKRLEKIRFSRR